MKNSVGVCGCLMYGHIALNGPSEHRALVAHVGMRLLKPEPVVTDALADLIRRHILTINDDDGKVYLVT